MRDDFAVFILTHGRPNNIKTLKALKKGHYTGKYYIIIDNEDDKADEYRKQYGDKVIVFDKLAISKQFDTGDLNEDRRTIVYARNACFNIAKDLGLKYFLELDDDYTTFDYRVKRGNSLAAVNVLQCDKLFDLMIQFLETDKRIITVAFAQGGDFIGGVNGGVYKNRVKRKAMNTFFCCVDRRFDFVGRINEDVNTYTTLGQKGDILLTITEATINQTQTQKNKGGMSDVYLDKGTYLKSFFTVMYAPSCCKIKPMGVTQRRLHHNIDWNATAPKIINEKYRKGREQQ